MQEKKSSIIRQPYGLTLAKHRLNTHEMRVMFRIIQALQPDLVYGGHRDEVGQTIFGNKIVHIKTRDLLPDGSRNHLLVKRALESIKNKNITIRGEDAKKGAYTLYTSYILKGKYYDNNEFVEIEIDKEILPCFLSLAKNYSKYLLEVVFNSSSPNVMKLYQFISHWKDKSTIQVDADTLRDWLQLGGKYSHSKDLRTCVLEPASKELKEKADVYFEIKEPTKLGRRIIGWTLQIFKKAITEKEIARAKTISHNIRKHLIEQFKFKDEDFSGLNSYLAKPALQPHIWDAVVRVAKRITNPNFVPVKNKRKYMLKALQEELKTLI